MMTQLRQVLPHPASILRNGTQNKLLVYSHDSIEIVSCQDIVAIRAVSNYSEIMLIEGRIICACKTLKYFEDKLTDRRFIRVHHSWIISVAHLVRIRKDRGYSAELSTGLIVPVARARKPHLLETLDSICI